VGFGLHNFIDKSSNVNKYYYILYTEHEEYVGMNGTIILIVVLYMLLMLAIGYYSSKKISTNTDFMVAGRRLGPLLMAGTLAATEIGGGS